MNPEGVAGVTFPATQAVYKFLGVKDGVRREPNNHPSRNRTEDE